MISSSIRILSECKFINNICDFNSIIQKYAVNKLQPIFDSTGVIKTLYFTPLYIGPLDKDFCNKYQLPYKDIIEDNDKNCEMTIRFNPNLLYLIPDQIKWNLIGVVEVNKYSLYNIENSDLMGISLNDRERYIPNYCYGKNLMLSRNICIVSDAEEIIYFKNDLPDIKIKENEISNSAYSYFIEPV